jgi:hypothetical protein
MQILFGTDHWRRFTQAECCASLYARGSYYVAETFERVVGRGAPGPRHMSVGRFRYRDQDRIGPRTPCWIPWTVLEPEEGDLPERWEYARQLLFNLEAEGFCLDPLRVRFSGNRSFWICIPAGAMGNPVGPVEDQRTLRLRVFLSLAECRIDQNLFDARHLLRVVGSEHESGGLVRTWPAPFFLASRLDRLFQTSYGEEAPSALAPLDRALLARCEERMRFYIPPMETVLRDTRGSGLMRETEEGVGEGNRNEIAFKRACVLIRRLGCGAWDELLAWNARNDPPLSERELRQCLRSAERTVKRYAA